MPKKYRYLIVRVEETSMRPSVVTNFAKLRKVIHEFSKETGINLADAGTSMLSVEDQRYVENSFDRTLNRAKEITRLIKKEKNEED